MTDAQIATIETFRHGDSIIGPIENANNGAVIVPCEGGRVRVESDGEADYTE